MNYTKFIAMICICLLSFCTYIYANDYNDLPSCYEYSGISERYSEKVLERELLVVIDGTFSPDKNLKLHVHKKVHNYLKHGDKVSIITFSAYVADNYTDILFVGQLDSKIIDRNHIAKPQLQKFDSCIKKRNSRIKKEIDMAIKNSFKPNNTTVPKTELLTNLNSIIAPLLQESKAEQKVVLLISDMVENSDFVSFYHKNKLRQIRPEIELKKIQKAGLISNFNQADIYIIGAGWLPKSSKGFRGGKVMIPLHQFWKAYFKASSASLKGFGQPMLFNDIQ